ncbi:MAG: enoyl-ACP reductase [Chloroflexi bacterium]|nr:enoyl-ACP reductase [Chloroflexota bacterium]
MKLLEGKKALIFGIANKNSIAWGIAQVLHEQGCELGVSYGFKQLERRVRPLAESIGVEFVEECNIEEDEEIEKVFQKAADHFGEIDILVHSIAHAKREDLTGTFVDTSRDGFHLAMGVSVYSLVALSRAAEPLMRNGGSIICMTYYGAEKAVPHYNVMGVAKAALEASTRYLAADLGPKNIRVNAISAGAIKTLSAAGISGFRKMLKYTEERSPLRRNVTQLEVGQTALWLCSDLSSGVTGEVVYVDAGYNILGMPEPPETWL